MSLNFNAIKRKSLPINVINPNNKKIMKTFDSKNLSKLIKGKKSIEIAIANPETPVDPEDEDDMSSNEFSVVDENNYVSCPTIQGA